MKFENFYKESEENMRLALLSLWTPGNNPIRANELFDREPYCQNLYSKVLSDGNLHQMTVGKML